MRAASLLRAAANGVLGALLGLVLVVAGGVPGSATDGPDLSTGESAPRAEPEPVDAADPAPSPVPPVGAQVGIPAPGKFPFEPVRDAILGTVDGARVQGTEVTVLGWVTTPFDPGFGREVQVGTPRFDVSTMARTVERWDVAAVHPEYGTRTGFEATLSLPRGVHELCVRVLVSTNSFPWQSLGCTTAVVPASSMLGSLDGVAPTSGGVSIQGWALQSAEVDPVAVHAYVDGRWSGAYVADQLRPDVGWTYPREGPLHGFEAVVPTDAGPHTVCVHAISRYADETNPLLGCQGVSVPPYLPLGSFDSVARVGDRALLSGWAFDPDTAGPVEVHVYRDGQWAGSGPASVRRDDVAAVHGPGRAEHGFALEVALPPGRHTCCVYAINQGTGGSNPQLGCRRAGPAPGDLLAGLGRASR